MVFKFNFIITQLRNGISLQICNQLNFKQIGYVPLPFGIFRTEWITRGEFVPIDAADDLITGCTWLHRNKGNASLPSTGYFDLGISSTCDHETTSITLRAASMVLTQGDSFNFFFSNFDFVTNQERGAMIYRRCQYTRRWVQSGARTIQTFIRSYFPFERTEGLHPSEKKKGDFANGTRAQLYC